MASTAGRLKRAAAAGMGLRSLCELALCAVCWLALRWCRQALFRPSGRLKTWYTAALKTVSLLDGQWRCE